LITGRSFSVLVGSIILSIFVTSVRPLDELVTEQELLLMDMLKNWNDIRTRLANIEPNNPMNEMFDKMIQDLVKIQNHTKNYRTLLEKMKQI